jgi:hypothetical protein
LRVQIWTVGAEGFRWWEEDVPLAFYLRALEAMG